MSIRERYYKEGYYKGLASEPRFQRVLKLACQIKGERFLDIGCGDGSFTLLLKNAIEAKEVFGLEIAPEAVALAQEKGIKAFRVDIDEANLPFEDCYFDVIYCGEIIEHLFDADHLLDEAYRVLKPEAICILTTPNLAGWPNRIALLLGFQPFPMAVSRKCEGVGKLLIRGNEGQWGHINVFTLKALKELVKLHSFRIEKITGCPVTLNTQTKLSLLIRATDQLTAKFPSLSTRIIMVIGKQEGKK